jgi:hypothetical protein
VFIAVNRCQESAVADLAPARRRAAGFFDAQAETRHGRLFADSVDFPKSPAGFRAEDMIGEADLEGFVSAEEAARRMVTTQDKVLDLARSGFLLCRWHRGRLLVRPAIV